MIAHPSPAKLNPSSLQVLDRKSEPLHRWRIPVLSGLLLLIAGTASADTFGDFTYTDNGTTVTITDYPAAAVGPVVIPATIPVGSEDKPVVEIGPAAFKLCASITSVSIPSSVTTIGAEAFSFCSALTTVNIPSGVTTIALQTFNECAVLTNLTLPAGLLSIGDSAFAACKAFTHITIPEGVTSVGASSFYNCTALETIAIPSTVTSIGINAFNFCTALTGAEIPSGVTLLKFGTFSDCSSLAQVTLPGGITSIEGSAFAKCTSLQTLNIPSSVASLGTFIFTGCTALTGISIPEGVSILPTSSFDGCSSLTSVTLPSTLTQIGGNAFKGCSSLISVSIPQLVSSIATDSFAGCTSLTSFVVHGSNPNFTSLDGVLYNDDLSKLILFPKGKAGSFTVPSSVTEIGSAAFQFCVSVTSIHIPSILTVVATSAFYGCNSLTAFTVDGANPSFYSSGGVLFKLPSTLFAYPSGKTGSYSIPSGITIIETSAFRNTSGLTSVTLPIGLTTVRSSSFANCSLLASATFLGNAPSTFATPNSNVFQSAASGFKVYFQAGATGFTVPTWKGYPCEQIGGLSPVASWLQSYGLPTNSSLLSDDNADGVSLLMAYALNLNPNLNLSAQTPQAVLGETQLSLSFYSGAAGVNYVVQASENMVDWSAAGVTVSTADANQIKTATVSRSSNSRFLRLVASY